jgi:hypothetical protein
LFLPPRPACQKLGAILVSAVGAVLNLLATLNEPSFVGFAVDSITTQRAFEVANALFLLSTVLLILIMLTSFVLLMLFGGDDLLPRVGRIVAVLLKWLCGVLFASCARGKNIVRSAEARISARISVRPTSRANPAVGVDGQCILVDETESSASAQSDAETAAATTSESEGDGDSFDDGAALPPTPRTLALARKSRRSDVRRRSSLRELMSQLQEAAAPAPNPEPALAKEKNRNRRLSVRTKAKNGAIREDTAKEMRVRATQHDRLYGDWLSMRDVRTGQRFYHNERTGESQWHAPSRAVMQVNPRYSQQV